MNNMNGSQILQDVYELIAELWCCPSGEDTEKEKIRQEAEQVIKRLESIDNESAALLSKFLSGKDIAEEDYIDLFELDPQCALYLGSHSYDEPTTCATAAVSDRNEYMIELGGIYNHFGRKTNGIELPDYLPLMVSFLSLTTDSKDDPIRDKFIAEFILPFLPPMRIRLAELKTPYLYLLDALEKVINLEVITQPLSKPTEHKVESYVG